MNASSVVPDGSAQGSASPDDVILPSRASPSKSRTRFTAQPTVVDKVEVPQSWFILDPDSSSTFYWTGLVFLATLFNFWIIILRIAFPEVRRQPVVSHLRRLDVICDLIYLWDIIVQMRTAYLMDGIPVFDPVELRRHYTSQPQFVKDVLSILPTETLAAVLPDIYGIPKHFLCEVGAARLTRLFKIHTIYKFYDLADSRTSNPNCVRALRLSLSLVIVIHWIGCLYYIVSEFEGLGATAWTYTNNTAKQMFFRKYIVCLYWSAMTLTTIGDCNPPETNLEYVFTGLTFLTGVFLFATVVGNVGDVISNMNATRQEFQARMDQIKIYLTHRRVPPNLQIKVKKWAEYSWSRTQGTDESRLLHMLPERLRAEIAVHVHLDTLRKVRIFEKCEHGFLCELVLKLRSQIYSPGDYICRVGETGREMYIINHGKVEVVVSNVQTNEEVVVAVLSEGNYFGEISLLRLDGVQNRRTADVRSVGYSELLCLSRRDLMAALVEYPEAKTILEIQAKERIRTNLQAKRTFSVDTLLETNDGTEPETLRVARDREEKRRDMSEMKTMIHDVICSVMREQLTQHFTERDAELLRIRQRLRQLEDQLSSFGSQANGQSSDAPLSVAGLRDDRRSETNGEFPQTSDSTFSSDVSSSNSYSLRTTVTHPTLRRASAVEHCDIPVSGELPTISIHPVTTNVPSQSDLDTLSDTMSTLRTMVGDHARLGSTASGGSEMSSRRSSLCSSDENQSDTSDYDSKWKM